MGWHKGLLAPLLMTLTLSALASYEPSAVLELGGSRLEVAVTDDHRVAEEELLAWVRRSAEAVAAYYGRFPVDEVTIALVPVEGRGVRRGKAFGAPSIVVWFGENSSAEDFLSDWVLVHEMVHLALPDVPKQHSWLEEGIASYVGAVARARAGLMTPEELWAHFLWGMPKGLPAAGDRGLDHTPTWGRVYWGGALYCLLADLNLRAGDAGHAGLQAALRSVLQRLGPITEQHTMQDVLAAAETGTGDRALTELYDAMKATPVETDLVALWHRLGVATRQGAVTFNPTAPLASIRRAIEGERPTPARPTLKLRAGGQAPVSTAEPES